MRSLIPVDPSVAEEIRRTAQEIGSSTGDLATFALTLALTKTPREVLTRWAAANPPRLGRPPAGGEGLSVRERRVLDALVRLRAEVYPGPWGGCRVFAAGELAAAAGLTEQQARAALAGLVGLGRVETAGSPELDRWGRPLNLAAWIAGDATRAEQVACLAEIVAVRRELFALGPDPVGASMVARKIRQSTGWSDRLVGLEGLIDRLQPPYRTEGAACVDWLRARWPVAVP